MRPLVPSLALLLTACAAEEPEPTFEDVAATLDAQGPHAVGWTTVEVAYTPPGTDTARTIPVEVWYPAAEDGGVAATYRVAGLAQVPAPHALDGATPEAGRFPVALYSHGSGGVGLLAYPFAERMASHGWLVLAPDHVGNTVLDLLTGGDPFGLIGLQRPSDVLATLDAAEDGLSEALSGAADTTDVYLFGHSFGGWTTLAVAGGGLQATDWSRGCGDPDGAVCTQLTDPETVAAFEGGFVDARITAIGPQAPAIVDGFSEGSLAALDMPALLQSGFLDVTTTHQGEAVPAWQGLADSADLWIDLRKGGHYSFLSICDDLGLEVIETFQPGAAEDGCGDGFTPTADILPELATWNLAFANRHVLGDPSMDVFLAGEPRLPDTRTKRRD